VELNVALSDHGSKINSHLSGSTLTVVLITDEGFVYTANVGDSKAVILEVERKRMKLAID